MHSVLPAPHCDLQQQPNGPHTLAILEVVTVLASVPGCRGTNLDRSLGSTGRRPAVRDGDEEAMAKWQARAYLLSAGESVEETQE
jgi:hypothetical protein